MTPIEYIPIIRNNIPEIFKWLVVNNPEAINANIVASGLGNPANTDDMVNILTQLYQRNDVANITAVLNVPYIMGVMDDPNLDQLYTYLQQLTTSSGVHLDVFRNMNQDSLLANVVPGIGPSLESIFSGANRRDTTPYSPDLPRASTPVYRRMAFMDNPKMKGYGFSGLLIIIIIILLVKN